jgi:hypothetical protein
MLLEPRLSSLTAVRGFCSDVAMKILEYLDRWNSTGAITSAQHDALASLVRKDRFSVFVELNTLIYLGVLAFVAGVGWTIRTYSASLGDAAILSALTVMFVASLSYCFSRVRPYSHDQVEPSGFAFDYVLYLGCLTFGVGLGYLEFRFHLMQDDWDHYLLLSSFVYFGLAYRFDNRFVLSLALSTLASWFGLRLSHFPDVARSLRLYALGYSVIIATAGTALYRIGVKQHFLEAYLHVSANVLFIALVSAAVGGDLEWLYLLGLLGVATVAIVAGVRFKRFAFVVYAVVYGYIGISARVIREIDTFTTGLAYVATSGVIVIASLIVLARRFGREE